MIDATPSVTTDPTLLTLVPKHSRRRNVALAAAALLALSAVWAAPLILRPSVVDDSSAGTWSALAPHHQVVTMVRLYPDGWPKVDLRSLDDVPGAGVVGAWVLPDGDYGLIDGLHPGDYASGYDYLQAALPSGVLDATTSLPQRLESGVPMQLVTLWDIRDCDVLVEGQAPELSLRSIVGSSTREVPDTIASPAFVLDTLITSGICPSR